MKKIFCAVALAAALTMNNTAHAMRRGCNHDHGYVGPVLSGVIAGWAYERILHRMPILLGLPMAGIAVIAHALNSAGYHADQSNATIVAALATATVLYAMESDPKQKVIIEHRHHQDFVVHQPVYHPRPGYHHHHAGCSHSH